MNYFLLLFLIFPFHSHSKSKAAFYQDMPLEKLIEKSQKGDINASFRLGQHYSKNRKWHQALKHFLLAAEKGSLKAQEQVFNMYYQGLGTKKDINLAIKWLEEAAKKNSPMAIENLAIMYEQGEEVEKNLNKSLDFYLKLVQIKNTKENLLSIAEIHIELEQYKEALPVLKKAHELGSTEAHIMLGALYFNGFGVAKDNKEALKIFEEVYAKTKNSLAAYNAGLVYERAGLLSQALAWYTKAKTLPEAREALNILSKNSTIKPTTKKNHAKKETTQKKA